MIIDPILVCLLSSAIYTFGYHGRSNTLFFLWTSLVIGVHAYHISFIGVAYILLECYENNVIPATEILLPVGFFFLATTRFFFSSILRSLSYDDPVDGPELYKSMGLNRKRCVAIANKIGQFPMDEFVRGARIKHLNKKTAEYKTYCEEFLDSYEKLLS